MYLTDYHTHSLCSPDGKYPLTAMAQAAVDAGLAELCVTDHWDLVREMGDGLILDYDWSGVVEQVAQARAVFDEHTLKIRMGMELPDFLIQLIAENITANVRQLEGTVNKIMAYQDLIGDSLDKTTVIRAVKDIFKEKSDILPTADVIIDEVCKFYNIEPATLRGQGRSKDISLARQIAMYLIRQMVGTSLKDIGKEFDNRDHSTVLNSLSRIESLVKTDPEKAEIIKDITTNINNRYE